MSRTEVRSSDGAIASSVTAAYLHGTPRSRLLKHTPGFLYILLLFIAGRFIFAHPSATLVQRGDYHLSWVEILLVAAAIMAPARQLRLSHPPVDTTMEPILFACITQVQSSVS